MSEQLEPRGDSGLTGRRVLIGVIVVILLGAVAGFIHGFSGGSDSKTTFVPGDVASYRTQVISWDTCDSEMFVPVDWFSSGFAKDAALCSSFVVPASYSPLSGTELPDLTIKVLKSPALDQENKLGTLFFNPGGPGESGINVVQYISVPQLIREKYDLVGFDPRGVGRSSPVKCADTDSVDYYFKTVSSPENEAEGLANEQWAADSVKACAALNPNWWVMTSLNTVSDMDIMREVVAKEDKFNFVGFSYGTTLAVEYIRAFPEHAGRIVLDSVTSNDDTDYNQAELESTYKALTALFEMCAADPKCPGGSVAQVENLIFQAQDQANQGKLTGGFRNLSSLPEADGPVISDDELIYSGLVSMSYAATKDAYPEFSEAMNNLVKGDALYFEYQAFRLYGWEFKNEEWVRNNSDEMLSIVNCLDSDSRDLRSKEKVAKDEVRFAAADPFTSKFFASDSGYVFVGKRAGCQWSWLAFADPVIPDPPDLMQTPVNESGQVFLVIGSKLDTVTPIENAQDTAKQLSFRLLTYEGSGHAPSFGGIACIDDAITSYLVTGYLPEEDIVCAAE